MHAVGNSPSMQRLYGDFPGSACAAAGGDGLGADSFLAGQYGVGAVTNNCCEKWMPDITVAGSGGRAVPGSCGDGG